MIFSAVLKYCVWTLKHLLCLTLEEIIAKCFKKRTFNKQQVTVKDDVS